MARYSGGAIVVDSLLGDGDLLADARRLAEAVRSLNGATRRVGGQMRATAAGYISAVGKTVRAVETLRDEQLAAFGDTARAWESARTRMNGLSTSLGELKRSLRDAFVPILTAAAPALTTLTGLLATAVRGVGGFMAALMGQNAFIRATGAQEAYVGSLNHSAKAAKALKRQLAGFDELDILRDASAGGSGGSGGVSAEALSGGLALLPVDGGIIDFAGRLRALFDAGNFDGLGRAIAEGLNGAIDKARELVRWERVGEGVARAVDGFCAAFNGLVDGVRWTEVGGALGDGVDTLLRTANRLLTGIDFAAVGAAIGDGLNGAIAEVDFDGLGEALSRLLTVKLTVAANAVGRFDWEVLGGKLAEGFRGFLRTAGEALDGIDWGDLALRLTRGLNRFIGDVDWGGVGAFLGGRLSDALGAMRAAVSAFDWSGAGTGLSNAVNGLVRKVDWSALGQWLDRTIKGVLDFGIRFVEGFDADGFAGGIARALDEVDWDGIAQKLWTLLSGALSKLGGIGQLLGLGGGSLDGLRLGGGASSRAQADVGVRLVKRGWTSIDDFVGTAVRVSASLGKANWTTIADYVGTSVRVLTTLEKNGWSSITAFVGDRVTALVGLARNGWTSLGGFIGEAVSVKTGLVKDGWSSIAEFVGDLVSVRTGLTKYGWTTVAEFIGEFAEVKTMLKKWGWSSITDFVGGSVDVLTTLIRNGWTTIGSYVGDSVSVWTALLRNGWDSITEFVGDDVSVWTSLVKWGWDSISGFVGDSVNVWTTLKKQNWTSISDFVGNTVTAKVQLVVDKVNAISAKVAQVLGLAAGGAITAGGGLRRFAGGGAILNGGRASWWDGVRKYASGTSRAHGTMFLAGEAGPEVVGHVNGRTEILNKSQMAQAVYSAVVAGMGQAVNALGRFLAARMAACAGALLGGIGAIQPVGADAALLRRLSAIAETVTFAPPAVASGSVVPYEVAAQQARMGEALRGTLDANNADLIQTIISVIGAQTSAIVAAVNGLQGGGRGEGGLSAQRIIDEINRRTQMFSASPLKGV